jgi:hypothetical protein
MPVWVEYRKRSGARAAVNSTDPSTEPFEVATMQNKDITESEKTSRIRLPNTCPENRRQFTHVRMLTQVEPDAWSAAGFHGALFPAGGRIPAAELREHPVCLEFAGPQGTWRERHHENEGLWILWRWDWADREWREIARALAVGSEWALILREPAIRALQSPGETADPHNRGREVSEQVLAAIESALAPEPPAVRRAVLCAVYDRMAGRLAAAA